MKTVEVNVIYQALLAHDLMTPVEVAEMFHVHPKTVHRWSLAHPDRLPRVITPGGRIRYRRTAVEALFGMDDLLRGKHDRNDGRTSVLYR